MHVGMAAIFQNPDQARSDMDVWRDDLRLALMAESLGFESLWGVEHHFTDYTMCPDVLQYLTFLAGATERVQLGSMVVVLPWHNPLRVAEQIAVLDHVSNGRFILGLGRGLGRVEFDGFGVSMDESRARFTESAEMILTGLERGYCEYDGKLVKQVRRDIRPKPFKSFKGRSYAAAVSPESGPLIAKLGLGMLIIPQKPWEMVTEELRNYNAVYEQVNGVPAPPSICAGWVFCDEDAGRAEEKARQYIGGYWHTVLKHYELRGDHLANTKGYESYARMQQIASAPGGADAMIDFFLGLQVWGTPERCYQTIVDTQKRVGSDKFVGVFSYAGMPAAESERNMRLFARKVLPELNRYVV
ncbi:MAG TPA: LLM class flavin-dependent oxidoreductase [Myxococcota bacterium]|nr:LLM class flavin-dependent oxidoreductase [Myxococcota bacterium]